MNNRKKPDLFVALAVVVGLGVIASSLAQGMSSSPEARAAQLTDAKSMTHAGTTLRP